MTVFDPRGDSIPGSVATLDVSHLLLDSGATIGNMPFLQRLLDRATPTLVYGKAGESTNLRQVVMKDRPEYGHRDVTVYVRPANPFDSGAVLFTQHLAVVIAPTQHFKNKVWHVCVAFHSNIFHMRVFMVIRHHFRN